LKNIHNLLLPRGRLAQTSLFEVCDAPKGHFKESRNMAAPMLDKSLREIADSTERSLRQPRERNLALLSD
jgi:hypothetical protein